MSRNDEFPRMIEAIELSSVIEVTTKNLSLKVGLFKWKPDYDSAADEYSRSSQCFRLARSYDKAKESSFKAAKCYKENNSFFHAGKSLEQAMIMTKESGTPDEIAKLAKEACSYYCQHGSPDSGSNVLSKAAKMLEEHHPNLAVDLYKQAADIVMGEDTTLQGAEYVSKLARLLVRTQRLDEATDALRREIGFHQSNNAFGAVGRLTVAMVLVQLAREDTVAAEKAYKEWGNCCEAPEAQVIEQLLQAYDDDDHDGARRALNSPFIMHMDVEYARLARTVPLPRGIDVVHKVTVRENAAATYTSVAQERQADDDFQSPSQSQPEQDPKSESTNNAPDEDELC